MSTEAGFHIYTGPWINWSKGSINGATITLSQRSAGLLTAFLGIFVAAVGPAFWRILCFVMHQYRAKPELQDPYHSQQQVVLRNASSPGAAAWQMSQMSWYWRKVIDKPTIRNLPFVALALLNMVLFGLAGVFSSEGTKAAGNERLIRSINCGMMIPNDTDPASQAGWSALDSNTTLAAITYSRACYGGAANDLQCNRYAVPHIPWTSKSNVTCPFPDICFDGTSAAYQVDSGLIDTDSLLGLNTPSAERLQYRKVTTCSVLNATDHSSEYNLTMADGRTKTMVRYYWGAIGSDSNYTWQYSEDDTLSSTGYALWSTPHRVGMRTDTSLWNPISPLNRTDADVVISFLAPNSVKYTAPVYDPLFMATIPGDSSGYEGPLSDHYVSNYWARAIACADQYQFCNPARQACTTLTASSDAINQSTSLHLSKLQEATFFSLAYMNEMQSTYYSVHSRGAASLQASDTLSGTDFVQIGLLIDQWKTEVNGWFSTSMARLQQAFIDYAAGPGDLYQGTKFVPGSKELCNRQKIRSVSGYISFSALGVAIILILGSLIIVTALSLDLVVGWCRRRMGWKDYKRRQWAGDEKLQLLRQTYDEHGEVSWTGETDAVPVIQSMHPPLKGDQSATDSETQANDKGDIGESIQHEDRQSLPVNWLDNENRSEGETAPPETARRQ